MNVWVALVAPASTAASASAAVAFEGVQRGVHVRGHRGGQVVPDAPGSENALRDGEFGGRGEHHVMATGTVCVDIEEGRRQGGVLCRHGQWLRVVLLNIDTLQEAVRPQRELDFR